MWFRALLIFISITEYQCDGFYDCMQKEGQKCFRIGVPRFPENKDGLDEACNTLQQIAECSIPVSEKCGKDEISILRMAKSLRVLESMCDPQGEIYNVIINNMSCLKLVENYDHHRCNEIAKPLMKENSEENNSVCLYYSYEIACIVLTAEEKCGVEPKDAVLDILMNLIPGYLENCSEDQIRMMPEYLKAFEMAVKELNTV